MAQERVSMIGDPEEVVKNLNDYLKTKPGFEPRGIVYGTNPLLGFVRIAFFLAPKKGGSIAQFHASRAFEALLTKGSTEHGHAYVDGQEWFFGYDTVKP